MSDNHEFEEALEMFQQWAIAYGQAIEPDEIDAQAEMHRAKIKLRYAFNRAHYESAGLQRRIDAVKALPRECSDTMPQGIVRGELLDRAIETAIPLRDVFDRLHPNGAKATVRCVSCQRDIPFEEQPHICNAHDGLRAENERLREALGHILDLSDENCKGMDGYEQISEWSRAALAQAKGE